MSKRHLPVLLKERLYVPNEDVHQSDLDAFTHLIKYEKYQAIDDKERKCRNCHWWRKAWRDKNGQEQYCHKLGYTEFDYCGDFEFKRIKVVEDLEVQTYLRKGNGYIAFSRGDLDKLNEHFGHLKIVDKRSSVPLGIDLEFGGKKKIKLWPEQKQLVRSWLHAGGGIIKSPTGCHRKGTLIRMLDGSVKTVEDILVGDQLIGPDSKPRIVKKLWRGKGQMWEVTPVKGDSFYCNTDHILTLVRTDTNEVVDVSIREYLAWSKWMKHIHKLFRTGVEYPKQNVKLPIDPYFIGVLLGDGSLNRIIKVTKPAKEKAIIAEVKKQAKIWGLSVRRYRIQHYLTSGIQGPIGRNKLKEALKSIGLWDKVTGTKFIPNVYLHSSREERLALLAGLLDTDGSLHSNVFDYITKSRQLGYNITELARSLGLAAYVKKTRKKCTTNGYVGTYYRVSISGGTSEIPTRIKRKQATQRKQKKLVTRTGFKIKKVSNSEKHYGFTLNGDGRYLLEDFTVTHNSGKETMLAYIACKLGLKTLILSHEVRHLTTTIAEFQKHTNLLELEKETGEKLCGFFETKRKYGKYGKTYPITLATYQSFFSKRGKKICKRLRNEFGLVWLEEVHHNAAQTWYKVSNTFNPSFRGGSTATPTRKDKLHCVIYDSVGPITGEGQIDVMPCEVTWLNSGIFIPQEALWGQYKWSRMLDWLGNNVKFYGYALEKVYKDIDAGYKPLVISERRRFAINLVNDLNALGYKAKLIIGGGAKQKKNDTSNQWKPIIDKLMNGKLDVIVGTQVLNEAVNIPPLDCLHLPFPSANFEMEVQRAGRIRRVMKGKRTPQIRAYLLNGADIAVNGSRRVREKVYEHLGFITKTEKGKITNKTNNYEKFNRSTI